MPVDGQGARTTLVEAKSAPFPATWSPDSKFLAYRVSSGGRSQPWVKPMAQTGEPLLFLELASALFDPDHPRFPPASRVALALGRY
jgi:hypothetical protein